MLEKDINVNDFNLNFCECPVTKHSDWYVFFMNILEKSNNKIAFLF